jgi:hypothetical protein
VPDCVDRLQGRPAGGGKKIESNIDEWKCLQSVRVQNISVIGGCSDRKKLKTMGMARFEG